MRMCFVKQSHSMWCSASSAPLPHPPLPTCSPQASPRQQSRRSCKWGRQAAVVGGHGIAQHASSFSSLRPARPRCPGPNAPNQQHRVVDSDCGVALGGLIDAWEGQVGSRAASKRGRRRVHAELQAALQRFLSGSHLYPSLTAVVRIERRLHAELQHRGRWGGDQGGGVGEGEVHWRPGAREHFRRAGLPACVRPRGARRRRAGPWWKPPS